MKTHTARIADRIIRAKRSAALPTSILAAFAAMLIGQAVAQAPIDPSVIYTEDFSSPIPLDDYNIENPPGPQSPMAIGIDNEALVLDYIGGFGVAWAKHQTAVNFVDTALAGDVRFETSNPSDPRSMGNIGWINGSSAQGYVSFGLQMDENRAYIFVGGGGLSASTSSAIVVDRDVTYRLQVEVKPPNIIAGFVNGQLVVSLKPGAFSRADESCRRCQRTGTIAGSARQSRRVEDQSSARRGRRPGSVAATGGCGAARRQWFHR